MMKFNLDNLFKVRTQGGVLSVDFGQLFVKVAYLECSGENFKLINYDSKKILPQEKNEVEAVEFINNFLRVNSIAARRAYLTISDSVIIKHLVLPKVPKNEVLGAIKWQLKEEASLDLQRCAVDWRVVKEYVDEEEAGKQEIVLITVKDEIINKYLSIFGKCSLNPIGITCNPFNYANALSCLEEKTETRAILEIGYSDSNLCIYGDNKLRFIRKLNFSSEKLISSLTLTLISDKTDKIQLSFEEAEHIKDAFGIPQDESIILKDNIQAIHIISLMRPLLEELVRELRYSFDYFISKFKSEDILNLHLAGEGANLKNLDWYLSKELKINVSKLPIPGCIDTRSIDAEKLYRDQSTIINALGAVLVGRGGINFIPPELKMQRIELVEKAFLRMVAFAASLILLLSIFMVRFQLGNYKKRLMNARAYLQAMGEVKVIMQKLEPLESLVSKIQKDRMPVSGLLKLISSALPPQAILEELFLDQDSHSLTLKVVISGDRNNANRVLAMLMKNIKASPFFIEPQLLTSKQEEESGIFEIRCNF